VGRPVSKGPLLVVTTEFGVEADGTYRPSGMAQFSRCVLKALAAHRRYERIDAWGLCDTAAGARWLEREYLPEGSRDHCSVKGYDGRRTALAVDFARHHWRYANVMFLHVNMARLSVLRPFQRHALWLVGIEVRRALAWHERQAVARAAPLLSISQYSSDAMRQHNPDLPPGVPVHLCVEPDGPWNPVSSEVDAPSSYVAEQRAPAVLIVGRLSSTERYKGHDQLLEAWPRILAEQPSAELWIAGDGDDRPRLKARASALGIASCVRFLGKVSHAELARLYDSAKMFAMPSTGEGFGLVFVEAMRHGLPCMCSTDSAQEIVEHEQTGLVVPQTTSEIAAACLRLLSDDVLCERFSRAGRERAMANFTFDAFARRLGEALP
jgi:phosphatidyl-myo-inositol dimannoside synthase